MRIEIAISTDDNYAKYCAATICSVVQSKAKDDDIVFHVLHGGLLQDNIDKLAALGNVVFHHLDDELFKPYSRDSKLSWPTTTLYRLSLSSILKDVDKVIYLDCDIIVRSSLKELFSIDISNYPIAGVPDTSWWISAERIKLLKRKVDDNCFYFNAGMLLMNLKKFRDESLEEKFFEHLKKHWQDLAYGDQDILNIILWGRPLQIPQKYNFIPLARHYSKKMRAALPKDIVVVHFAGTKPWQKGFENPFEEEFWTNFKKSRFLSDSEYEKLYESHKNSRGKTSQILRLLKRYPLAVVRPSKFSELVSIISG